MANMLRANQAAKAIYKPKGLVVYGECNHCLLATVNAIDGYQAFAPGGPVGSIELFQCQFCHCHRNIHRGLDGNNHQVPPAPTQQQTVTQRDVKTEASSNTKNTNHLSHITAQIFNSPGVSIAVAKSIMARATQKWVYTNKNDGGNKRKKSWDEYIVEEYEKEEPQILANQLEWTLNMRSENEKNKKIKKDEDEKLDGFEMYIKTKGKAIKKLHLAQAGESTSSDNHNCPN
ncbi:hypothetical protein RDI58_003086 [Solanum bulbocastanum]|uniref:ZF-HD dimerization-type domain-containing protein n=1 Tax=Solanum bulbocastanum TaxID=147425 RepID=A0AAN8UGT2_SOLBU